MSAKNRSMPTEPSYTPATAVNGVHNSMSSVQQARYESMSRALIAATARSTTSTFSCDIAYSRSPTASRASSWSQKPRHGEI